jgi:hypothetical protein
MAKANTLEIAAHAYGRAMLRVIEAEKRVKDMDISPLQFQDKKKFQRELDVAKLGHKHALEKAQDFLGELRARVFKTTYQKPKPEPEEPAPSDPDDPDAEPIG